MVTRAGVVRGCARHRSTFIFRPFVIPRGQNPSRLPGRILISRRISPSRTGSVSNTGKDSPLGLPDCVESRILPGPGDAPPPPFRSGHRGTGGTGRRREAPGRLTGRPTNGRGEVGTRPHLPPAPAAGLATPASPLAPPRISRGLATPASPLAPSASAAGLATPASPAAPSASPAGPGRLTPPPPSPPPPSPGRRRQAPATPGKSISLQVLVEEVQHVQHHLPAVRAGC